LKNRNETDPSVGNGKAFSIRLERAEDGFYTCPRCGAPSLYFNDMAKHVQEMHSINIFREISNGGIYRDKAEK
jgi:uncharacterized C2H2 Zn-finger protein